MDDGFAKVPTGKAQLLRRGLATLRWECCVWGLGARVQHTTVIAFNDRVELLAETTPIVDFQELLDLAVET